MILYRALNKDDIYNYEISEKEENGVSKQYQRARDKKYKTLV